MTIDETAVRRHQVETRSKGKSDAPHERASSGRPHGQRAPSARAAFDAACIVLATAVGQRMRGGVRAPSACAYRLTEGEFSTEQRAVDAAVAAALDAQLRRVWSRGWLPQDVHRMTLRRLSDPAPSLAIDAIAADCAAHAAATVDPRWLAQVEELDALPWWDLGRPHLTQWAARHGVDRVEALETTVELLALLGGLPTLPSILPPPGAARPGRVGRSVNEKMLGRVRSLLAKAESTAFPEEAELLSAKAQELMSRYAIEHALLDAAEHTVSLPGARRVWLDQPYLQPKALLVGSVASANRCRAVSTTDLGFVTLVGDELDLQIVELLTTSLMVQATSAMLVAGQQVDRRGQSRTRSFRHAFLVAYATRIGERLRDRAEDAVAAAGRELVPVLAEREAAVDDRLTDLFPSTTRRSLSVSNARGWSAGRAAADAAVLRADRPKLE